MKQGEKLEIENSRKKDEPKSLWAIKLLIVFCGIHMIEILKAEVKKYY